MNPVRSASAVAVVAIAAALAGCSQADGNAESEVPAAAPSCIPMTMDASPSPAVVGEGLTLEFEFVHATCDDVDPSDGEPAASGVVSLVGADGSWRANGVAQFDVQPGASASTAFIVPEDTPAGTISVMVFDREIGQIQVVAP